MVDEQRATGQQVGQAIERHGSGPQIEQGERNKSLFHIACALRREGFDQTQVKKILEAVNQRRCVYPLSRHEVGSIAKSASRRVSKGDPSKHRLTPEQFEEAKGYLLEYFHAIQASDWRGRLGTTDRHVLLTLVYIARDCFCDGRDQPVKASQRQLAERASMGRQTIVNSLRRLQARGWLRIARHGTTVRDSPQATAPGRRRNRHQTPQATAWRLLIPAESVLRQNKANTSSNGRSEATLLDSLCRNLADVDDGDIWRNGSGLGHSCQRVYELLCCSRESFKSASALARAIEIPPRTAQRALLKLEEHGMVTKSAGKWILAAAAPEEVAPTLRSHGARERARAEHQRHRERFAMARLRHQEKQLEWRQKQREMADRRERRRQSRPAWRPEMADVESYVVADSPEVEAKRRQARALRDALAAGMTADEALNRIRAEVAA